jgi:hypothetical protein
MLEIPASVILTAVNYGIMERRLVQGVEREGRPLVYPAELDRAEQNLAENLIALSRDFHPCPQIDVEKAITWVEQKVGLSWPRRSACSTCGSRTGASGRRGWCRSPSTSSGSRWSCRMLSTGR